MGHCVVPALLVVCEPHQVLIQQRARVELQTTRDVCDVQPFPCDNDLVDNFPLQAINSQGMTAQSGYLPSASWTWTPASIQLSVRSQLFASMLAALAPLIMPSIAKSFGSPPHRLRFGNLLVWIVPLTQQTKLPQSPGPSAILAPSQLPLLEPLTELERITIGTGRLSARLRQQRSLASLAMPTQSLVPRSKFETWRMQEIPSDKWMLHRLL